MRPSLVALAALLVIPAVAAQPINDTIFQAAPIVEDGDLTGTNVDADSEPFQNTTASCTTTDNGNAVWWVFKATAQGLVTIDLAGSTFDTVLSIVATDLVTELACDDDGIPNDGILTSQIVDFSVEENMHYYVRVVGFNSQEGDISLSFSSDVASLNGGDSSVLSGAPYDTFSNNLNLNDNGEVIGLDRTFPETNVGTTAEAGETPASCTTNDGSNSTWRAFSPTQDGFITLTLEGSTFDTVLSLRSDIGTELACDDDGLPNDGDLTSRIDNFPVLAGTVYHIRITGFSGASGDITMRVTGNSMPVAADPGASDESLSLLAPAPNPASGAVRLAATLAKSGDVTVEVFDALGRRVAEIANGSLPAGLVEWTWDPSGQPAGVYVVRLTSGSEVHTQRLTVVR